MSRVAWRDYIIIEPDLQHGDPCIKGTRTAVVAIVGSLADGMTQDEILAAYPHLQVVEIQAALAYAADVLRRELFAPFAG